MRKMCSGEPGIEPYIEPYIGPNVGEPSGWRQRIALRLMMGLIKLCSMCSEEHGDGECRC